MATVIRSPQTGGTRRIAVAPTASPVATPVASTVERKPADGPAVGAPAPANVVVEEAHAAEKDRLHAAELATALQAATARTEEVETRLGHLEQELEAVRERARDAGLEEGLRKGQEQGQSAWQEQVKLLQQLIIALDGQRGVLLEEAEDRMVEIVFAAIARLLGDAIVTRVGVRQVVVELIRHVSQRDGMLIHVAPDEVSILQPLAKEMAGDGLVSKAEFVADERVEVGGCIIETEGGSIDGRLEVQLQSLKEALLATRARRRAGADEEAAR